MSRYYKVYKRHNVDVTSKRSKTGQWHPTLTVVSEVTGQRRDDPGLAIPDDAFFGTKVEADDYAQQLAVKWLDEHVVPREEPYP